MGSVGASVFAFIVLPFLVVEFGEADNERLTVDRPSDTRGIAYLLSGLSMIV
jgi:hypothetical protein